MQYCRWRRIHKLITRKKVRLYLTFTLKTYLDTNLIYCRFTYYVTNLMDQKDKGCLRLEKVTKLDKTCVRVRVLLTLITELMIIIITITILLIAILIDVIIITIITSWKKSSILLSSMDTATLSPPMSSSPLWACVVQSIISCSNFYFSFLLLLKYFRIIFTKSYPCNLWSEPVCLVQSIKLVSRVYKI